MIDAARRATSGRGADAGHPADVAHVAAVRRHDKRSATGERADQPRRERGSARTRRPARIGGTRHASRARAGGTSPCRRRAGRGQHARPRARARGAAPRGRARRRRGRGPPGPGTSGRRAGSSSAGRLSAVSSLASIIHVSELLKVFRVPVREGGTACCRIQKPGAPRASRYSGRRRDRVRHRSGRGRRFPRAQRRGQDDDAEDAVGPALPHRGSPRARLLPSQREQDYLRQIALVMGNETSCGGTSRPRFLRPHPRHLPPRRGVPGTRDELAELLDVDDCSTSPSASSRSANA